MTINKSHAFVLLFILFAGIVTYITYNKIPHSVVIHINDRWHVMLVGETRINHLNYHGDNFVTENSNAANLWLRGTGLIQWQAHRINVQNLSIMINHQEIATSHEHSQVHLMLYPDGRVTKGKLAPLH